MGHDREQRTYGAGSGRQHDGGGAPGKATLTSRLVQRKPANEPVVQRKTDGEAGTPASTTTGVPLTQTLDDAHTQLDAQVSTVVKTPYPDNRNYPGPPEKASDIENRLKGYGVQKGPTAEEKEWLYQAATLLGLSRMGEQYRSREAAGKPVNPARAAVVAFALSQIGLVEAHTGAPDPENPGKKARKGYRHLEQYYSETGRTIHDQVLRDHTIKVGPEGGNKLGSWCQIFSEWAVQKGGGTFKIGGNQVKVPQPGDVAYMARSQHMAVVVSVEGDQVTTVDGNMPSLSAIMVVQRPMKEWDQGFHDSFPGT